MANWLQSLDQQVENMPGWVWWLGGGVLIVGGILFLQREQQAHDQTVITQAVQAQSAADSAIVQGAEQAIVAVAASMENAQSQLGDPGTLFNSSQFADAAFNGASGMPPDTGTQILNQGPPQPPNGPTSGTPGTPPVVPGPPHEPIVPPGPGWNPVSPGPNPGPSPEPIVPLGPGAHPNLAGAGVGHGGGFSALMDASVGDLGGMGDFGELRLGQASDNAWYGGPDAPPTAIPDWHAIGAAGNYRS